MILSELIKIREEFEDFLTKKSEKLLNFHLHTSQSTNTEKKIQFAKKIIEFIKKFLSISDHFIQKEMTFKEFFSNFLLLKKNLYLENVLILSRFL